MDRLLAALPLLALLVFAAELCVVTLATLRIIFVSRGMKGPASVLGFFEVSIWLFAIGQVMANLSNLGCSLGFAAGFTVGNFLGVVIEKRLAIGTLVVRIITHKEAGELIHALRAAQYGVTTLDGCGATGPVKLVFTVIQRRELDTVLALIRSFDPSTFYSVDEIQEAGPGIFPAGRRRLRGLVPEALQPHHRAA
jgi:uncharacterized protein YebE (UPF0316 family)